MAWTILRPSTINPPIDISREWVNAPDPIVAEGVTPEADGAQGPAEAGADTWVHAGAEEAGAGEAKNESPVVVPFVVPKSPVKGNRWYQKQFWSGTNSQKQNTICDSKYVQAILNTTSRWRSEDLRSFYCPMLKRDVLGANPEIPDDITDPELDAWVEH